MLEIQSSKIVLTLVDTETGELFTKEATFGDFKEVTKKTVTRTKKVKDDGDPVAKLILEEGKWRLNKAAIDMTGFEPEMKLTVEFEKNGRVYTPVLMESENKGNRLTKSYTCSCRGSKHDNLAEYGTIFELQPYEGKDNFFKLIGNAPAKEDDIIDVPEEIEDDMETNIDEDFDFNLDE